MKFRKLFIILLLALVTISCDDSNHRKSFKDAQTALDDYSKFLKMVSKSKGEDSSEIINLCKDWKIIDDSVMAAVVRDTTAAINVYGTQYCMIRDSIQSNLVSFVDKKKRTLKDYYYLATEMSAISSDTIISKYKNQAIAFENKMDSTSIYNYNSIETIYRYENLLKETIQKGLNNKADVLSFLLEEDRNFKTFLSHLSDLGDIDLKPIREDTERIMNQIIIMAEKKDSIFTSGEIAILLTMRIDRRLIQNAIQCINDVKSKKGLNKNDQSRAYAWMIIQPWISLQRTSFLLLSDQEKKQLLLLANDTQKCINTLGNPKLPVEFDNLPETLMKVYIYNI